MLTIIVALWMSVARAATLPADLAVLASSADPSVVEAVAAWQPVPTRARTLRFVGTPPGTPEAVAALLAQRLLDGDDTREVQIAIVRALQDGATLDGHTALWSMLWSERPELRGAILGGLEADAVPAGLAQSLLIAGLADPTVAVRQEAARVSGYRSEAALTAPLVAALQDERAEVRRLAARSLGWRQDRAALTALRPLLQDTDASVRLAALRALEQIDAAATRALPEVQRLRQDADDRVARLASTILGETRTP